MTNDNLTRIGRGVPVQQQRKPRRWWGIKPEVVIIAAVVIAVGMMTAAATVFEVFDRVGQAKPDQPSASVETQMECANIKHAYTVWSGGMTDLVVLGQLPSDIAGIKLKDLAAEGKAFLDATSGHKDQPSKHLASVIAEYNYDVTFLALESLGGKFKDETYEKAVRSWDAVGAAYKAFVAETCS